MTDRKRKVYIITGIMVIMVISIIKPAVFVLYGEKSFGIVTELIDTHTGPRSVIQYTINGKNYIFHSDENVYFEKGSTVPIIYSLRNFEKVRVNSFLSLWGNAILNIFVASVIWAVFILSISRRMLHQLFRLKAIGKIKQNK